MTESIELSGIRHLASVIRKVGCPIRKSADQSFFAAPHGLSQRSTSFIASQRQGIHRMPLRHLIVSHYQCPSHKHQFRRTSVQRYALTERPACFEITPMAPAVRQTPAKRGQPPPQTRTPFGIRNHDRMQDASGVRELHSACTFPCSRTQTRYDLLFTMSDNTRTPGHTAQAARILFTSLAK